MFPICRIFGRAYIIFSFPCAFRENRQCFGKASFQPRLHFFVTVRKVLRRCRFCIKVNIFSFALFFRRHKPCHSVFFVLPILEWYNINNRQLRKVTKNKSVFPTDDSLLKMLYLAMIDITKKWTGKRKDWGQIHSQLEIFFADRLPQ